MTNGILAVWSDIEAAAEADAAMSLALRVQLRCMLRDDVRRIIPHSTTPTTNNSLSLWSLTVK